MNEEEYRRLVRESISSLEDTIQMSQEWFANVWRFRKAIELNPLKAIEDLNLNLENMPNTLIADKNQIKFVTLLTLRFIATSIVYESKGITLNQWLERNRVTFSNCRDCENKDNCPIN